MSSISLNTAISGLKAAQRALDTIANNVSNASTEGYTRKILPQETLLINGVGVGVKLQAIMRNVDQALLRDLLRQTSVKENYTVKENYLSRIQDFHGAAEAERSLSARIGQLADAFSELSSAPDNSITLNKTLIKAQQVAQTFNDFSQLIRDQRIETEDEIQSGVAVVNQQLELIADLNRQIAVLTSQRGSAADLEDQRDIAVKKISEYIEVSSFKAEDNKLVLLTKQGQLLTDTAARTLSFSPSNILPTSYYPGGGLSGLILEGAGDITQSALGGKFAGLFELRDTILPRYQAQADELAQKLSHRLDQQGLRLFTDDNGNVPANVADPGLVGYVGYAAEIQVNIDVVNDIFLLREGTTGATILPGSNEIIRKVSEFAFGNFAYQEAVGTVDISAGTIFGSTGLTQQGLLIGNIDLTDYVPDLGSAPNLTLPTSFILDIAGVPQIININPGDTATDLVNNINTAFGSPVASLNGIGQLRLSGNGRLKNTNVSTQWTKPSVGFIIGLIPVGALGIADLGLSFGVTPATNPSFTVQVGTQSPVTVAIGPADTQATLLATLNAIPGLTATLGGGGELILTPTRGGDITLQNSSGNPIQALGLTITNTAHEPFRVNNLGPDGSVTTSIIANGNILDYSRNLITAQSQDHNLTQDRAEKEIFFFETLNKRLSDESGVNVDEELALLIRVQTAYSAAARMVSASEKMLDELLAAFS